MLTVVQLQDAADAALQAFHKAKFAFRANKISNVEFLALRENVTAADEKLQAVLQGVDFYDYCASLGK